jgi:hypothetical protein
VNATTATAAPDTAADGCRPEYYEDYAGFLRALLGTRTREDQAILLDRMVAEASRIAPGSGNPLSWQATASLLCQMAIARRGMTADPVHRDDRDHLDEEWAAVAAAVTAEEFTAAFAALRAGLTEISGLSPSEEQWEEKAATVLDEPVLAALARQGSQPWAAAIARLAEAAAACAAAMEAQP